jgi:hypothetical protein
MSFFGIIKDLLKDLTFGGAIAGILIGGLMCFIQLAYNPNFGAPGLLAIPVLISLYLGFNMMMSAFRQKQLNCKHRWMNYSYNQQEGWMKKVCIECDVAEQFPMEDCGEF